MGSRGPAPKRSTQRRRTNDADKVETAVVDEAKVYGDALEGEHSDQASRFWEALRRSGQAQFYEASDWAAAELQVLAIDQFVNKPSAMLLSAIQSGNAALLVTEGDRRRMRLELERAPDEVADESSTVAQMDDYRVRVAAASE